MSDQHFILIFGPPAVGKMTVGRALAKRTGLKLFHNHLSIELALQFFEYEQPEFKKLNYELRERVFEAVAQSDLPGLIFTWVWALELEQDYAYIEALRQRHFAGARIGFVELEAPLETLLQRNQGTERLLHKPSKRNLVQSEQNLRQSVQSHQLNSDSNFSYPNHLKIQNQDLSPEAVAEQIAQFFDLPQAPL